METIRHFPLILTAKQEEILKEELGISRQRIYSWKMGYARPRPKEAMKISKRLKMSFEKLVGCV